ncbi:hypothetical protein AB0883_29750 [Micromonospora sp. NPDC047812]|uniref:hypothetical protein n=1 Tax=Micromonospora sp. NPDC047812 TaxID=3155742 RepID=UPI003451E097
MALAAGMTVPFETVPAAAAAPCTTEVASLDESEALAAAKRLGSSVEVTSLKTETSRVMADPRGALAMESYAVPQWTKDRRGGGWQKIDTRLQRAADGTLTPMATLAAVAFSAGGAGPAVRLAIEGGHVELAWPGALPTPRLEGDTAVYGSVLPGVDLRLRALVDGFTWVLVVTSPQAAKNPALDELRFGLRTTGSLARRPRPSGGFDVVDASGRAVVSTGSALMWDSSGLIPAARAAKSLELSEVAAQERREVVRAAPDLARKAELATRMEGADLVIRPDLSLLRGSEAAYPVVIDPWTTINKGAVGLRQHHQRDQR